MDSLIIKGGIPLRGQVKISGAKNSALKLMCAALLTEEPLILHNIPQLADIATMAVLLTQHGVKISNQDEAITLQAANITNFTAPYTLVKQMRASLIVLGPLLSRFGQAKVSLPGGCAIGTRPVDLHLQALEKMGAHIEIEDGYILAKCKKLKGAKIEFASVSVGATENILMAATLAQGQTILKNAAQEPEISDLANCLVKMGAKIDGIGSDTLKIEGVEKLKGTEHEVIADRIETGSFITAAAITGGDIELINAKAEHLQIVLEKLTDARVDIEETPNGLRAKRIGSLKPVNVETKPYPGFPTDMQAQFMALMTLAEGDSEITETIFENRFMHVPELVRMGAEIKLSGHTALLSGVKKLKAAEVMATDLRASFSLVIAALAAEGESKIGRVYHIDRGYEKIARRLQGLGAEITRVKNEKA